MRQKVPRHKEIMAVVQRQFVSTQGQIAAALQERGMQVSQATLSNDLKELGLVKTPAEDGRLRYCLPTGNASVYPRRMLKQELVDFLVDMDSAGHLLVLKTPPGNAPGLAAALDRISWNEVVGTVAGDDTILVVCKTPEETADVMNRIRVIIQNA